MIIRVEFMIRYQHGNWTARRRRLLEIGGR